MVFPKEAAITFMPMYREINAIRKADNPGCRVVELKVVLDSYKKGDPLRIQGDIKLEGTQEQFDELFGGGFDVGDRVELLDMDFEFVEQQEQEED